MSSSGHSRRLEIAIFGVLSFLWILIFFQLVGELSHSAGHREWKLSGVWEPFALGTQPWSAVHLTAIGIVIAVLIRSGAPEAISGAVTIIAGTVLGFFAGLHF